MKEFKLLKNFISSEDAQVSNVEYAIMIAGLLSVIWAMNLFTIRLGKVMVKAGKQMVKVGKP